MRDVQLPTARDFERARVAVRQKLRPTPLLGIGGQRWLKLETQQPAGAFKVRGAVAALSRIPTGAEIVTASAGNHAIGIAWAAANLGQRATIVVPTTASPRKLEILHEMGANVVQIGTSFEDAEHHALHLAESGLRYISGYNDPHVVAGQGSIVDELLNEIDGDFTIVVPVGGGGLISGIHGRAAQLTDRKVNVIGVEAEASMALSTSVKAGEVTDVHIDPTLADGLAGNIEPGSITVQMLLADPPPFLKVTEREIRDAIRELYLRYDLTVEGSAAVSYAALKQIDRNGPIVALLTGRNIAKETLKEILTSKET